MCRDLVFIRFLPDEKVLFVWLCRFMSNALIHFICIEFDASRIDCQNRNLFGEKQKNKNINA